MGVHRNIDANFLRGVMPKVPSKKHPYENFGMPYVFLWILQEWSVVHGFCCTDDEEKPLFRLVYSVINLR